MLPLRQAELYVSAMRDSKGALTASAFAVTVRDRPGPRPRIETGSDFCAS